MTRETWRRARGSFDRAYAEFKGTVLAGWPGLDTGLEDAGAGPDQDLGPDLGRKTELETTA